jgi:hypothetical protein
MHGNLAFHCRNASEFSKPPQMKQSVKLWASRAAVTCAIRPWSFSKVGIFSKSSGYAASGRSCAAIFGRLFEASFCGLKIAVSNPSANRT